MRSDNRKISVVNKDIQEISMDNKIINFVPPSKNDLLYHIHESTLIQKRYDIYFSKPIDEPGHYAELCQMLRLAPPDDVFYFYLNTPGGNVNSGIQIIHAMRDSSARIITVLDGTVCSMGSLLFLAANECIVHDTARIMFHNYSGGVFGKGHEQISQLTSTAKWITDLMADICFPFLNEEELNNIISGKDMWLDSEDIRKRLDIVQEYKQEIFEAERDAIEREQEELILKRIEDRKAKETKKAQAASARQATKQTKAKVKAPKPKVEKNTKPVTPPLD